MKVQQLCRAVAMLFSAVTAVPSWGAVILTSSHVNLQSTVSASTGGQLAPYVEETDANQIDTGSTLVTQFNDAASVSVSSLQCAVVETNPETGEEFTDCGNASANGQGTLSADVAVANDQITFNVAGTASGLVNQVDGYYYWWTVIDAQANSDARAAYDASFILTSPYHYTATVLTSDQYQYDSMAQRDSIVRLSSSGNTIFENAYVGYDWFQMSFAGTLDAGDYQLSGFSMCNIEWSDYVWVEDGPMDCNMSFGISLTLTPVAVPVSAALPLLASGLLAFAGLGSRARSSRHMNT